MRERPPASQPAIILVEPQLAENIGTTARAMLNFGLTDLRLVNPKPDWPSDRAKATASGADRVLDGARVFRSLGEAIADLQVVYATSNRPRDLVKRVVTPRHAAGELRAHVAADVRPGILFGPERTGLVNDDLALADAVISAPVNPSFGSLNLAQAVLLIGYEWFQAADATAAEALHNGDSPVADRTHLMSFLNRLEFELDDSGFLRVPHMRPAMIRNIRAIFSRMAMTDQEVRTLHGILTELVTKRMRG
jgi:tRNA/rRNA methyltransferase